MTIDDERATPPSSDDVAEAYRTYRQSKTAYLETLARHIAGHPDESDSLFNQFRADADVLRVLHAVSVGYGWSDAIYKVSTRAHVAQAQLRGLITHDQSHGGIVLTHVGVELLRRWTEYLVPLIDKNPGYRDLWRTVTGLEG